MIQPGRLRSALPGLGLVFVVGLSSASGEVANGEPDRSAVRNAGGAAAGGTCLNCHLGIEEIHPGYLLSCVDCHGGDDSKEDKKEAHVLAARQVPNDERVLKQNYDLPYQRFRNPSNLRVAEETCGTCHTTIVRDVLKSPHGTTAGHLGDGFYEHGLVKGKKPTYSIFPVRDQDGHVPQHGIAATTQVPGFKVQGAKDKIETHYSDLPRKACMHCHFYSEGRAVNGRLGLDGDYRGEGCAGCHVTYAEDGRSRSGDKTIDQREPGHPLKHRFTTKIPTSTCVSCHYGDASIGLHFRGMAQLVPGMPAGPEVAGTTDRLLNGTFYIKDPAMTPPDIHHQKGMHCIDCHTANDVMGDGNIYPQMDFAVEIECTSCHGTFDRVSDLMTSHGNRVSNLKRVGDDFFLVSKVTGKRHKVTQVKYLLDPKRPEYNRRAAAAMNDSHGRLECYTCHNGWNVNFFGFHFDRNEQFTQLDLISG
ncbi:MAG: multiheme c-type cytochrome, partial [Planctomycetota bacterium]